MAGRRRRGFRLIYLLLAVPFIAMIWIGSYNRAEPAIWGIPFFYWYQLLWDPLGALLIVLVYLAEERGQAAEPSADDNPSAGELL